MTTPTALRWLASDQEFYASLKDYAVVSEASAFVQHAKTHTDTGCNRRRFLQATFAYVLRELDRKPSYSFATEGHLVYADVDSDNPEHIKDIYSRAKEEQVVSAESDDVKYARKRLIQHLMARYNAGQPARNASRYKERAKARLRQMQEAGVINDVVIDYIVAAKTEAAKTGLLNIMSGQTEEKFQRPVLVLIGMIDDMQTLEVGVSKGWVIGYEFVKNLLIIKPFISTPDQHPLGGSWFASVQDEDGILYSGPPANFAGKYVHDAQNQHNPETAVEASGPSASFAAAFKTLVHTVAANWILSHGPKLFDHADTTNKVPNRNALKTALRTNFTKLKTIIFPVKEKANQSSLPVSLSTLSLYSASDAASDAGIRTPTEAVTDAIVDPVTEIPAKEEADIIGERVVNFRAFRTIQRILEDDEKFLRDAAINAKAKGDDDTAERAAALFENVLGLLKDFNEGDQSKTCWSCRS